MPKPGQRYTHGWKPIDPSVTLVTHVVNGRTRKALKEQHKNQTWPKLAAFFDDTDNGNKITLAHKDGKVIGGVEYYHYQGDAYVHSLHVDRSAGVKGLGTHLMQHVAQETVARPKGHLRGLTVVGALTSAQPFYERLGGTNLMPHQVKALAEGNPVDEAGNPIRTEGTYNDRVQIHRKRQDGNSTYEYADLVKDGLAEKRPKGKKDTVDLANETPIFNIEKVRDAYSARQAKKRDAAYARQREQRAINPMADVPMPLNIPYRYCKEIWNTHLIVKGDNNDLYKVPYTVGPDGASFTFGPEKAVTEQYVELSHADEAGLLAEWDDTDHLIDLADSEHVPEKGGKNWVTKTGGLPEYINRIAKDLMDKGMAESHAIATAVNTVKKWAAGGKDVKPATRAKAAAALAEWESKKAAAHTSLSTPARLDRASHGSLSTMDLAAVLDRTAQIDDPGRRAEARLRVLDLAARTSPHPGGVAAGGGAVASGKSYSLDELATKRAKFLMRAAAKAKKGSAKKAGSRKTKKKAGGKGGAKSKFVKPPDRVKPITAGGMPKWSHGWVPANDAARAAVKKDPQKYARMRAQQGGSTAAKPSTKSRRTMALAVPPGVTIDLADRPGQRFRHGWIPISPGGGTSVGKALRANPPKVAMKAAPKIAGSRRKGLVDGLTKEQHRARSEQLVQIPRSQRTPEQHLAFARSNAVLRGQQPPTRTSLPTGAAAAASTASTLKDAQDRRVRAATKGAMRPPEQGGVGASALPAGQTSGSTGGMTDKAATHPHNVKIAEIERRLRENDYTAAKDGPVVTNRSMLEKQEQLLHAERGKALWPDLSPENARFRSVQDHQYRNGDVSVGPNWKRPDWYTGPRPKRDTSPGPHNPTPTQKTSGPAWSSIPKDYKGTVEVNGVKVRAHLVSGPNGTTLQPWVNERGIYQAVNGSQASNIQANSGAPSAGQIKRAEELAKGSTGRSPRADEPTTTPPPAFERKTFKGHGIKHGDTIEAHKYVWDANGKGGTRVIRGTAHVNSAGIGIHDGDNLHTLGGVATKVMARKIGDPASLDALKAHNDRVGNPKAGLASEGASLGALSRLAQQVKDERAAAAPVRGAHPEKFKPGEKPPVHKFMNTERLQQIAADTSLDPEKQANAAAAKAILAKRNKSTGITRGALPPGYKADGAYDGAGRSTSDSGGAAAQPSTFVKMKVAQDGQVTRNGTPIGKVGRAGPGTEVAGRSGQWFARPPGHEGKVQTYPSRADAMNALLATHNATPPRGGLSSGNDATRAMTERIRADRVKNAETMYGTGSPQHLEAQRRFGASGDRAAIDRMSQAAKNRAAQPGKTKSGLPAMVHPTTPDEKMAALRTIVDKKTAHEITGVAVDIQTANAALKVLEALSPANREKMLAMPFHNMLRAAWKLVK